MGHVAAAWSRGTCRNGLPATMAWCEYDEVPRWRVVYDRPQRLFVIYADRKLQTPAIVARIVAAFGLNSERTAVRSDAHYRT